MKERVKLSQKVLDAIAKLISASFEEGTLGGFTFNGHAAEEQLKQAIEEQLNGEDED